MPQGANKLLLEMFTIFVSARLGGELFANLALPAVLGEIAAGVLLGPHALRVIAPTENIQAFAELGAIFVLFTAGLEIHPQDLVRVGRQSLGVALAGVIFPFVLGFAYMRIHGTALHEAVFVAAAMVATSVGVTASVLDELRVLQSRFSRIILGAAVFDDILGMILLAVVVGMASGGVRWLHLGITFFEALAFTLFMIFVGPRVVHHMQPGLRRLSTENAPLALSLALCLMLSWASGRIGMAAIIGAFFAGMVLADYAPEWELEPPIRGIHDMLAPFFFFAIGARLDIGLLSGGVLWTASVVTVLAIISKLIGCGLPIINEGWPMALRVSIGMVPRGEVALIVALIGLQMNVISQSAFAIVIFMTAITTLVAPPALRWALNSRMMERAAARAGR
jgi:Kef-type K+ transport system membrane component KefB